jgi:beta-N-acetylhexosaminidase
LRILESFAQEYRNDQVFARLVDAAVTRILTKKINMYGQFNISDVAPSENDLAGIGSSQQVTFEVARNAATLISPDPQELNTLLPAPPSQVERIVFLTDTTLYRQCSGCLAMDTIAVDMFQKTVLRLYGPSGSGQVLANRLSSYSLNELNLMFDGTTETNIESALSNASWIIFSLTDVGNGQLDLLRRFFSERPNLIRNKDIILFSFTAPYYLDATDISKLTAYYALYGKQPEFVDVAARLLFQQISLEGYSPVSIPAVGYDLITQTSPDPAQVIPLLLDQAEQPATEEPPGETLTPEPTPTQLYKIGNTISVRAGPILDHNGHIVPDSTPVRFTMSTRDETGSILQQVDAETLDGVARASFVIDKPGKVEIRVVSEPAVDSGALRFDATNEGVAVTVVVPDATQTPEVIPPTPTVIVENDLISPEGYPRIGVWLLVLLAVFGSALLTFWAVSRMVSPRWGLRFALSVLVGGFGAYNYLALGFPHAVEWIGSESGGAFGVLLFTLAGEALGIILVWIWARWLSEQESQSG